MNEALFYLIPLCICVFGSWMLQLKKWDDAKVWGYLGFIPGVNIVVSIILVVIAITKSIEFLVSMPDHLSERKKRG